MIARLAAIGLVCLGCFSVSAQSVLADKVNEARAEWMFGKWVAEGDGGGSVTLTISWDLDKNVVVLHVKTGDMESKGYTAIEAGSEEPKYVSFDNRGTIGKGTWGVENEQLVLRVDNKRTDGESTKMGAVFGGSATEGLKVELHSIDSSGDLVSPARMSLKFKKQK